MDSILEKIKQFSNDQYSNENRLKARIQLYKFCEHKINWHRWVFDNLDFTGVTNVLDLGCGNGALWTENIDRLPVDMSIILSDISEGMVDSVRKALRGHGNQFQFKVVDACRTPFHDAAFQMIIANHMLYYDDDNKPVLGEINRLLTDDGIAYATTPSMENLKELVNIAVGFNDALGFDNEIIRGFNFENGKEVLSDVFTVVDQIDYQNDVHVKTCEPLHLYLASIYEGGQLDIYIRDFSEFSEYLESAIERFREIRITNKAALFRFRKK